MRSRFAAIGAILYLAVFACAAAYPLFDHSTFAGLAAVLLGLPWIDYLPSGWLLGAIALNALIIYLFPVGHAVIPAFLASTIADVTSDSASAWWVVIVREGGRSSTPRRSR
jgi:hypothetical protein